MKNKIRTMRIAAVTAATALTFVALAGCAPASSDSDKVTICLLYTSRCV